MTFSLTKNYVLVQMRQGSTRLKNKMLKRLGNFSVTYWVAKGIITSKADQIIFALPNRDFGSPLHLELSCFVDNERVHIFFGSENDVYSRFKAALRHVLRKRSSFENYSVLRVCGDRPLISASNLDKLMTNTITGLSFNHYHESNNYVGFGAEKMSPDLAKSFFFGKLTELANKEHVTKNLYDIDEISKSCDWDPYTIESVKKLGWRKMDLDDNEDWVRLCGEVQKYNLTPLNRLPEN